MGGSDFWLLWPLLRPVLAPARGTTLVVLIEAIHRVGLRVRAKQLCEHNQPK